MFCLPGSVSTASTVTGPSENCIFFHLFPSVDENSSLLCCIVGVIGRAVVIAPESDTATT